MSSFTCFEFFANVLDCLESDDDREALAVAVIYYGTRGAEPDLPPHLLATFEALRDSIDNSVNSRTNNKGGRPRASKKKAEKPSGEDEKPKNGEKKTGDTESETGVKKPETGVTNSETPVSESENPNLTCPNLTCPDLDREGTKRKRFIPPTVEQVAEYARSRGDPSFDADRFVNYYTSKGWVVGKAPMKDWKSAVRNWVSRDKKEGGAVDGSLYAEYA